MNRKLYRVLDEIQRTEKKIVEWQEHLKELKLLAEQLENQEIVKTIRSMKLDRQRMLEFLEGIQRGTLPIPFPVVEEATSGDGRETGGNGMENHLFEEIKNREKAQEEAPESEEKKHEKN